MPFETGRRAKGDRICVCAEVPRYDEKGKLVAMETDWRPATIVHMPGVGDTEEQWCVRVDGKEGPSWIFHETQWKTAP